MNQPPREKQSIEPGDVGEMPSGILNPQGKPARTARDERCPDCGKGLEKRVASSGFGVPYPVCSVCGHEWPDEVFGE